MSSSASAAGHVLGNTDEAQDLSGESVSPIFCDDDADLSVLSSDGTLFKVFSKDLAAFSGAFPSTEFVRPVPSETIVLSETSSVLDLLFQFMRPQRQPDLSKIPFDVLSQFAEAVEKYEVFTAGEVCRMFMTAAVPDHALEVFAYATRHDFIGLSDLAAPRTIGKSLEAVEKVLPAEFVLPWVKYRERWQCILKCVFYDSAIMNHRLGPPQKDQCKKGLLFKHPILMEFSISIELLLDIGKVFRKFNDAIDGCSACIANSTKWQQSIQSEVQSIPNFSTFLKQNML